MNINKEEFVSAVVSTAFYCMEYDAKRLNPDSIKEKILVKYCTGGSSGGNCWGDKTSEFNRSDNERKSDASSELTSVFSYLFDIDYHNKVEHEKIKNFAKEFVEENWHSYELSSYGDYSDYYGNGSSYEVLGYPLEIVFQFLKEKSLINDEDIVEINNLFSEEFTKKENEYNIKDSNRKLILLKDKVKTFEKDMKKELTDLERDKENLKKQLVNVENKIKNFNTTKEKSMEDMNAEIENLESFLSGKKKTKKTV